MRHDTKKMLTPNTGVVVDGVSAPRGSGGCPPGSWLGRVRSFVVARPPC